MGIFVMMLMIAVSAFPVLGTVDESQNNTGRVDEDDATPTDMGTEACVEVDKTVLDPATGQWCKETGVCLGAEVEWKIMVTNCGNCELDYLNVIDVLDNGLTYIPGSANFQPHIISPGDLLWSTDIGSFGSLSPMDNLIITFKTTCDITGFFENNVYVNVSCLSEYTGAKDSDSASVSVGARTKCGIINQVSTYPANWNDNWDDIDPLTMISFEECNGDKYILYGPPDLVAANNGMVTLGDYERCKYAKYCWIEKDGKKMITQWETVQSGDCDGCCEYCCYIDLSFLGRPIGGSGSGGGGPPSRCPGEMVTYKYKLSNACALNIYFEFINPSPEEYIIFDPPRGILSGGEEKIIFVHYIMPGSYNKPCSQDSRTFIHELAITIIIDGQNDIECTPIQSSVFVKCHKCPDDISCCDNIDNLRSGEGMLMQTDPIADEWDDINIITFTSADDGTWNPHFGDLDDHLHDNCGAEWVYGIHNWKTPKRNFHEHYKLNFIIPSNKAYEIALSACIDDEATFSLSAPWSITPTKFFSTTWGTGMYSNFPVYCEGLNGEMQFCLPHGEYTLYIDHWDTGGVRYGLIFAATNCYDCSSAIPDLDCNGTLQWSAVRPGDKVTGSFQVMNAGGNESQLNWNIAEHPEWGTWTFIPMNGTNLNPENGPVEVEVEVEVPDEENANFTGEIKIINSENEEDYEIIPITLTTPKNKVLDIPLFMQWLQKRYPLIFQILWRLLVL